MALNTYASYLGGANPLTIIAATTGRLRALAARIGTGSLNAAPAPGKWSARDILCHLADSELVFGFRLRHTLADDHHVVQPFDQDRWARPYADLDAAAALAAFGAVRAWNLALLGVVGPGAFDRPVTHPERGDMTFRTVVETMAGHDLNHLAQLEPLASERGHASL